VNYPDMGHYLGQYIKKKKKKQSLSFSVGAVNNIRETDVASLKRCHHRHAELFCKEDFL